MNRWIRWHFLAASFLCLWGVLGAQSACADFSGPLEGHYDVPGTGTNQTILPLTNGKMLSPDPLVGKSVDDLTVDLKLWNVPGDPVDLGMQFKITVDESQYVNFLIVPNMSFLFPDATVPLTGTITTTLQLDPMSPGIMGFDQNAFQSSLLTLTYGGIQFNGATDGTATWGHGAFVGFRIESVPEPSALTLALVGVIALTGIRRLRRRKKLPGV
jgi:hypothetical protein